MKKASQTPSISDAPAPGDLKGLTAYFDDRRQALKRALGPAQKHFAVEGIHELRVEIKKLRVFYGLLAQVADQFPAAEYRHKLRRLFRRAGRLRDIDIEQELIRQELARYDLSEYFNYLKSQELKLRPAFVRACRSFERDSLTDARREFRKLLASSSAGLRQNVASFGLRADVVELVQLGDRPRLSPNHLHDLRKRAKSLRYRLDVYQACLGKSQRVQSIVIRLKAVYDHLGAWRDLNLTCENLRRFRKNTASLELFDSSAYARFSLEIKKQRQQHLGEYLKSWRSLTKALRSLAATFADSETDSAYAR